MPIIIGLPCKSLIFCFSLFNVIALSDNFLFRYTEEPFILIFMEFKSFGARLNAKKSIDDKSSDTQEKDVNDTSESPKLIL